MYRKLVVPISEIEAVRWTCPKCKTVMDFPLAEEKTFVPDEYSIDCPVCGESVAPTNKPSRENTIRRFHSLVRQLRDAGASIALVIPDDR